MPGIIQSSKASDGAFALSRIFNASKPSAAVTTSNPHFTRKRFEHTAGNGVVLGD